MEIDKLMEKAVSFHGHACPGLAFGVLVSKYILDNVSGFSIDEELAAVVENDNCSVDALQALLGTTFGKGNFTFLDHGKNVYTIYNRTKKKAVRLSLKNRNLWQKDLPREERIKKILASRPEDIFNIEEADFVPPAMAEIRESIECENCGEPTMSTRIKSYKNKKYCIPCFNKIKDD